jgi:hypothetical protein
MSAASYTVVKPSENAIRQISAIAQFFPLDATVLRDCGSSCRSMTARVSRCHLAGTFDCCRSTNPVTCS